MDLAFPGEPNSTREKTMTQQIGVETRPVRPIRTRQDHASALREVDRLWGAEPDTADGDYLDVLLTLVADYEDRRFPIPPSDPIEVLHFAIREMNRSQSDLARILGSRSRASEVLSRKRALTLDMIRAISAEWHLPIEALVRPYAVERETA